MATITVRQTFKYRLYQNRRNRRLHDRINISGIIWNHLVALQRRYYRLTGKYASRYEVQKHIARLRREVIRFQHWQLVGSQALQELVERHDKAYQQFFAYKRGERARHGRPGFKKVKRYKSFTLKQAGWKYEGGNRVWIQGTWYKFSFSRPVEGRIKTVTIKRDNLNNLWVCFSTVREVEVPDLVEASTGNSGGFDFGLKAFLTDHEGRAYHSSQFLKRELNEIARLNRSLSRKVKGSNNWENAKRQLAKAHARIASKRRDAHWKLAYRLCERYDTICLESLNLEGMKRVWGRKVSDLGFGEFVTILKEVALKTGTRIVQVNRWEPTTKRCACCGRMQEMPLAIRVFDCQACGWTCDRDQNAALNILKCGLEAAGASAAGLGDVRREYVRAISA
jgi:putative transposase